MSTETKRGVSCVALAKKGFTIIELLTVMSIIIVMIGLLVPGLNRARKVAKDMTQRAQFYDISKALEEYRAAHQDEYPDSNRFDYDSPRIPYCGAMKLCEALVGQDGMGFHPDSKLQSVPDLDSVGDAMYPFSLCVKTDPANYTLEQIRSMKKRFRYLENLNIRAARLDMLYGTARAQTYSTVGINAVLTDVYNRATINNVVCPELAGQKVGMPILYYKADVRKYSHDANEPIKENLDNIYDYRDNHALVALGLPWDASKIPAMADMLTNPPGPKKWFYEEITNPAVTSTPTPYNKESYILMSAGYDGEFGTNDDIINLPRR